MIQIDHTSKHKLDPVSGQTPQNSLDYGSTKKVYRVVDTKHTPDPLRCKQLGLVRLEQHASTAAAAVSGLLGSRQFPKFMIVQ